VFGKNLSKSDVEVDTVDSYQGSEKDIMIFNCVRANTIKSEIGSLGFVTDDRRLNVAITRARHFLFIVGNSSTLKKNELWSDLVDHCKKSHSKQFPSWYEVRGNSTKITEHDIEGLLKTNTLSLKFEKGSQFMRPEGKKDRVIQEKAQSSSLMDYLAVMAEMESQKNLAKLFKSEPTHVKEAQPEVQPEAQPEAQPEEQPGEQ